MKNISLILMPRGRPVKSRIRQNIVEILYYLKEGYAYEIYKIYRSIFPKATMRSIYYNLRKGVSLGEFKISRIEREKGDYSWGPEAEKTYYSLGRNASPSMKIDVKEAVEKYIESKK
ncbi:hypothetical protein DRJ17_01860 [Candidatus Woesearchaeota archaeon]|nr:MAG: hypothetical protein DRJ17_01860 [Candidatus Woesearchaeota archaeon]